MIKVLMIEDDPDFAEFLSEFLLRFGIEVSNIDDPFKALSSNIEMYDLIILDLTLEGMDGLQACKQIRQKSDIPIIISSARGDITDKMVGFERGADDYLPKPYDPNEMYLRITSVLKRVSKSQEHGIITMSLYEVISNEILYEGIALSISQTEFDVMTVFIKNFNKLVTREQVVNASYNLSDPYGKGVDMLISRLRQKLVNPTDIVTIRGLGYKLVR